MFKQKWLCQAKFIWNYSYNTRRFNSSITRKQPQGIVIPVTPVITFVVEFAEMRRERGGGRGLRAGGWNQSTLAEPVVTCPINWHTVHWGSWYWKYETIECFVSFSQHFWLCCWILTSLLYTEHLIFFSH